MVNKTIGAQTVKNLRRKVAIKRQTRSPIVLTDEMIKRTLSDLQNGKMKTKDNRVTLNDGLQPGFQVLVYKKGDVTLHAIYTAPDGSGSRPNKKIGDWMPGHSGHMSLAHGRALTGSIRKLADHGIDIGEQENRFREQMLAQILKEGANWRPNK